METSLPVNPTTFEDYAQLIQAIYEPAVQGLSPGNARVYRPGRRAHYTETASQLEAWARPYWGIIPLTLGYQTDQKAVPEWLAHAWIVFRGGITHGTNPDHEEYWGKARDYDQRFVEMAAIALGILLCPQHSVAGLSRETKLQIASWFDQGLAHDIPPNNWRYFRIFTLLAVLALVEEEALDYPESKKKRILSLISADLTLLESFYQGDGWYSDGPTMQRDYYVSFAMHFYPLVLQSLQHHSDIVRSCTELRALPVTHALSRSMEFATSFRWWFDTAGRAIPFGRSLTYRFAQASFWSVLATQAEVPVPQRIAAFQYAHKNICWWMKQPIFLPDGTLSIGYRYENHTMAESYSSFGGPYWAFKSFWFLSAGAQAPWWHSPPVQDAFARFGEPTARTNLQTHAFSVLRRDELPGDETHAWLLSAGQDSNFYPGNTPEKYAKYAYSSRFGFAVSTDRRGISHTSSDNTTLITDDGVYWRSREKTVHHRYGKDFLESTWNLWHKQTQLTTRLEFTSSGYKRFHTLNTQKQICLAEGGFALPATEHSTELREPLSARFDSSLDGMSVSSSVTASSTAPEFPYTSDPETLPEDWDVSPSFLGGQILPLAGSSHLLFEKAAVPAVVLFFAPGAYQFVTEVTFRFGT